MRCLVTSGRTERAQKPVASASASPQPQIPFSGLILPALPTADGSQPCRMAWVPAGPPKAPPLPEKPLSPVCPPWQPPTASWGGVGWGAGVHRGGVAGNVARSRECGDSDPKLRTPQAWGAKCSLEIGGPLTAARRALL